MDLNIKQLFDESMKELVPTLKKEAKEFFKRFFDKKLGLYFCDQKDAEMIKNNPNMARLRGFDAADPDLGLANNMASDFITEHVLNDDMKVYMKQYMDANWKKELHSAMDKAMKHKANAIAFKEIRKVGGPERACVMLFEILDFLKKQNQSVTSYTSIASTDFTEICLPYVISDKLFNSFAVAFPKCTITLDHETTYLKVFYDEHANQQVK